MNESKHKETSSLLLVVVCSTEREREELVRVAHVLGRGEHGEGHARRSACKSRRRTSLKASRVLRFSAVPLLPLLS